jgi:hypothetical protein
MSDTKRRHAYNTYTGADYKPWSESMLKGCGVEYWSKRPCSISAHTKKKAGKKNTHRCERMQKKEIIFQAIKGA